MACWADDIRRRGSLGVGKGCRCSEVSGWLTLSEKNLHSHKPTLVSTEANATRANIHFIVIQ
jgi:hypothetical protein